MRYGFLDEAGDVGYAAGAADHFVVVAMVVGNPDRLRKAVIKTRKGLGRRRQDIPEMKATDNAPVVTQKLLVHAVQIGFDAVAVVIDKRTFPGPRDSEDLYRYACLRVVREALSRWGPLTLTVDRRYTKTTLRSGLEQGLISGVKDLGIPLRVRHEDSKRERILQIADAVAWTLFQKYERGDETHCRIVQGKVIKIML